MTVAAEQAVCARVRQVTALPARPTTPAAGSGRGHDRAAVPGRRRRVRADPPAAEPVTADGRRRRRGRVRVDHRPIRGGTQAVAEAGAAAFATAVLALSGKPVQMDDTGVTCLAAASVADPVDVPPPDEGEVRHVDTMRGDRPIAGRPAAGTEPSVAGLWVSRIYADSPGRCPRLRVSPRSARQLRRPAERSARPVGDLVKSSSQASSPKLSPSTAGR